MALIAPLDAQFLTSGFKFTDQMLPGSLLWEAVTQLGQVTQKKSPKASPRSTQPGKMSYYIFVLMSPPCGFNTHLPLNVSDEKRIESLAAPSLQQEGVQRDLRLACGKSSNTVTKTGRERNVRGAVKTQARVLCQKVEMEKLHRRLSESRGAFSKAGI